MRWGVVEDERPSAALRRCIRHRCLPFCRVLSLSKRGIVVPPKGVAWIWLSSVGERSQTVMASCEDCGIVSYEMGRVSHSFQVRLDLKDL